MKLYLCFILFLISIMSVFAQVSDDNLYIAKTSADKLRDIKGLRVVVQKFTQEYVELGFDENKINSFISEKLRDNNCLAPDVDPFLNVNITPLKVNDDILAASVSIYIYRPMVYPVEDKIFIANAVVWELSSTITFPADQVDYIYEILGKLMDKFIIEWLKSQIPYKEEIKSAPAQEQKVEPKEEPKKEGAVIDEKSLRDGEVVV